LNQRRKKWYLLLLLLKRSAFKICADDKETVSGLTSAKLKLIQSWRDKTLVVIKRH